MMNSLPFNLSQPKPRMKVSKNPSQGQSLNDKNQFIYNFFEQKRRNAQLTNNPKLAFCYKKVMNSIEKYPLPILSSTFAPDSCLSFPLAKQALELEGVGPKMASMIGVLIKNHYKDFILSDATNFISSADSTQENSRRSEFDTGTQAVTQPLLENENDKEGFSRTQSSDRTSENDDSDQQRSNDENSFQAPTLKRARSLKDDDGLDFRKTLKKYITPGSNVSSNTSTNAVSITPSAGSRARIRDYKPEKNSSSSNILLGLYSHRSQTGTNFASKKEIKYATTQLSKVTNA